MKFLVRLLSIAACLVSLSIIDAEASAGPAFMTTVGRTSQPIGHVDFCRRYPQECEITARSSDPMVLTPQRWQALLDVNYSVNTAVKPETDEQLYGKAEYWTYPTAAGDCEDYALQKQRLLVESGFPESDVLLTVVLQPNGDGHAVLTVHTDRGDFILDNMQPKVLLWSDTDYTYLKRQSSLNSGNWDKIRDGRPALVGSVR